jgi:hypothetical protein
MVRRDRLERWGHFQRDLGGHADYEMWLRLAASGERAAYVDERLAFYRVYEGTMSRDIEHMRRTRIAALERIVRSHPDRVARGLSSVQELAVDLHTANSWMRDRLEPFVRDAETRHRQPEWTLLDGLATASLIAGPAEHLGVWDTTLGGQPSRVVVLHAPATLEASIPSGAAGRLMGAIAIHPDAWPKEGACACTFAIEVDKVVAVTALLDPARRASDRRWIEVSMDVPASPAGRHVVTLETQPVGGRRFSWAIFKDVRFTAAPS